MHAGSGHVRARELAAAAPWCLICCVYDSSFKLLVFLRLARLEGGRLCPKPSPAAMASRTGCSGASPAAPQGVCESSCPAVWGPPADAPSLDAFARGSRAAHRASHCPAGFLRPPSGARTKCGALRARRRKPLQSVATHHPLRARRDVFAGAAGARLPAALLCCGVVCGRELQGALKSSGPAELGLGPPAPHRVRRRAWAGARGEM